MQLNILLAESPQLTSTPGNERSSGPFHLETGSAPAVLQCTAEWRKSLLRPVAAVPPPFLIVHIHRGFCGEAVDGSANTADMSMERVCPHLFADCSYSSSYSTLHFHHCNWHP